MQLKTTSWTLMLTLFAALPSVGCDGGGDGDASDTDDGDTDGDAPACDPVGETPEQAALFNAPVEGDVEVVSKAPKHPGEPGPDNLP